MGLLCAFFYRAVGFKLTTIFLAHFKWDTIKRSLIYGIKLTGGQAIAALSWGVVPLMMLLLLDNFLELNEIFIVTFALTYAYLETGAYIFTTLMPTISESYSHGKIALTRRYLDQGLRWGIIGTTMLGGAFVAFSDVFIRGLLPAQFARAAAVIAIAHLWRFADFWTRLPDQVFQGVGRTGLYTWTAIIEHVARMILAWYFIKAYGLVGVFYAFIVSSALKALLAWPLMLGFVISPALSLWQTIINPALTTVISYFLLRGSALLLWRGPGHSASAAIAVLFCLFGSLPIYMFISGWLGWDSQAMSEFSDAVDLVPAPFAILARFARYAARSGVALSPFHNRFSGKLIEEAIAEADALTKIKAELV
jgi:O-antigen/teichoic acid export membrane protein